MYQKNPKSIGWMVSVVSVVALMVAFIQPMSFASAGEAQVDRIRVFAAIATRRTMTANVDMLRGDDPR